MFPPPPSFFSQPMPHPAGVATTDPISQTGTGRKRDPMLSVKLYEWRSEEFRKECALVYTSRSNPSHTCISHWKVNRNKVIFTLQDHLCEGNPVMLRMEIKARIDSKRACKIRGFRTRNLGGEFTDVTDKEPECCVRGYKDRMGQRKGEFTYSLVTTDLAEIDFTTGIVGGPALSYTIIISFFDFYLKLDAVLEGPVCRFLDGEGDVCVDKGFLCSLKYVKTKPSSNVIEQLESYVMQQEKQLEGNDDIHKASSSSSSAPTLTQRSAILNSGENRGPFSGATINAQTVTIAGLTEAFRGLSMGFYK